MSHLVIWTVGHSTHSIQQFLTILKSHDIQVLVDVRRYPASRRHPQFNAAELAHSLPAAEIEYQSFVELGGRRPARPDSHNTAWRNDSFRGYADYMETNEFQRAAKLLMDLAAHRACAIMCAETLWWRCHRALISDYLKVRGWDVRHIVDEFKDEVHPYTSAARIKDGALRYDNPDAQLTLL